MKRAYSLIRFSSWKQAKGESQRRQAEWSAAWCERNGCLLDESLKWDRPVSAFRGKNQTQGPLAAFLEMVRVGRVAKGSILLLESLDRLTREDVDEAFVLFQGILKTGVEIVTMVPERHYTKASIGDIVGILEPLVIMSRANEESATKSDRVRDAWDERRKLATETPMCAVGPAWLRLEGRTWQVIPERVAVIERIFRLAIDGYGLHAIAHVLNGKNPTGAGGEEGDAVGPKVPTMGRSRTWCFGYLSKILRGRAVLGEFQPHVREGDKRKPVGNPIPDYYPAIIDEATFHRAQAALTGRKNQKGPRGRHVRNLFTGVLRDARDGETMVLVSESDKSKTVKLVSSGAGRGLPGSDYRTFPYTSFEAAFLALVKELKASDVMPRPQAAGLDEVATLSGRLQEIQHRIDRVKASLKGDGDFDEGLEVLRELGAEKKETAARLDKAKAEAATAEAETLGEVQTLIGLLDGVEGDELLALRTKIKARIAELVSDARVLILLRKEGRDRLCVLQVRFKKSDQVRELIILHRPQPNGVSRRPGGWWARSLADVIQAGGYDLRKREDAERLAAVLQSLDPAGLGATPNVPEE